MAITGVSSSFFGRSASGPRLHVDLELLGNSLNPCGLDVGSVITAIRRVMIRPSSIALGSCPITGSYRDA